MHTYSTHQPRRPRTLLTMPAGPASQRRARGRSTSSRNVLPATPTATIESTSDDAASQTPAYTPLQHIDSESDGLMFDDEDDSTLGDDLKFGHPAVMESRLSSQATTKSRDLKFPICTCAPLQSTSAAVSPSSSSPSSSTSASLSSGVGASRSFLFPTKAIARSSVSLATTAATSFSAPSSTFGGSQSDYNAYVDLVQSQTRNITKRRRSSQQQAVPLLNAFIPASTAPILSSSPAALPARQPGTSRRPRRHSPRRHLRNFEKQNDLQEDEQRDLSSSEESVFLGSSEDEQRRGRSASPKPLASFTGPPQPSVPIYEELPEAASVADSQVSDVQQFNLDDYFAFKPKVLTAKLEALLAEAPQLAATAEPFSYGESDYETDDETDVEGDESAAEGHSLSRSFAATSAGQRICQPYGSLTQPIVQASASSSEDEQDDEPVSEPESDCSIASFVLPDLEFEEEDSNSRQLALHRTRSYGIRTPPTALALQTTLFQADESVDTKLDKALAFARWNKRMSSQTSPSSIPFEASDTLRQLIDGLRA